MNLLTAEHISKAYSERILLDDVNFSIHQGEKIGIIGTNGMGKSTLLKVLAGTEECDRGEITMGNHVHIRFLSQNPGFWPDKTLLDVVLEDNVNELNRWSVESEAKSILNQLALPDFYQKASQLSGGQKKRAALANALLAPAEILILDEPTNHLDDAMSQWLEEYLLSFRGAILLVTHDRYFLDRVVTRIVEVDGGKLYSYPGNYSKFVQLKAERQNMEIAAERKRQSILRVELEWLQRGARARATKQKAHIQRIEDMQALKGLEQEQQVQMKSIASRLGRKTIAVNGVSKRYGEKELFREFSYIFLKDDRIGIVGPNGCGKSTLLKLITGHELCDTGDVEIGDTIKIGYFSQENEYMDESVKAIEYIKEIGEYIRTADGTISASQLMEQFLFDGTMQWTQISSLSGGEKRRLYLLHILMGQPNVLILDEPTNDLDIQTLTILEDYLDAFGGIVITVSHDRYFLDRVVNRIFAFEESGEIRQYEGGYSDYLSARAAKREEVSPDLELNPRKKNGGKEWKGDAPSKLKFTFKEKREYETIDEEIARLEALIGRLDGEIEVNATNSFKLRELIQEKEEAEQVLEEKMERWVYLNDLAEEIEAQNS